MNLYSCMSILLNAWMGHVINPFIAFSWCMNMCCIFDEYAKALEATNTYKKYFFFFMITTAGKFSNFLSFKSML